ncbi:Histone acetyltransferase HPA2/related acetyltransferase [Roseobacter sp. SK209-2-6]|uniref:GNAT family N-acetyltransferase n=1 Tax=Roseobacter sp. SK209-2-6 TaxID=388739 RepID=UPI0000F3EC34|nr:GNAT family protein [Roseobacter sp. SK209-2-6]EBA16616.1 Histone acetyltransferase HPA2/related acetyltransferase [Roseobacter sp. SK209-2-6]
MEELRLAPLAKDEFRRVRHIWIPDDQVLFAGSIQQAFGVEEPEVDFHILETETRIIGFFKVDRGFDRNGFALPWELGIRAFKINHADQSKGFATRAVTALRAYLQQHYPDRSSVVLTVNMQNPAALACYLRGGFQDTGEIYTGGIAGPQHVLRMSLEGSPAAMSG